MLSFLFFLNSPRFDPTREFSYNHSMKVFITGGTGFIGSNLVEYLLNKYSDIEIFALVRDLHNLKWLKEFPIHPLQGNLFSIPSLPKDMDCIFHIAGLTKTNNLAAYYTVNQQGTASLFQQLHAQGISPKKAICLSSLAAAGPSQEGQPVRESHPPRPVSPYGQSKLYGEWEALKFKDIFPVTILRVGAVFGPRDRDVLQYFQFIKKGILPSMDEDRLFSLCYVKDLVRAMDLCLESSLKSGEILNIADPKSYSWDDLGRAAALALGKTPKRIKIPLSVIFVFACISELLGKIKKSPSNLSRIKFKEMRQAGWVADITKAQELLNFSPQCSFEAAVQETIRWYCDQGWL